MAYVIVLNDGASTYFFRMLIVTVTTHAVTINKFQIRFTSTKKNPATIVYIFMAYVCKRQHIIGLYRENAIAIESEARDPFGGNVYYVTMQITFPIPEFARKERNLHCDVVHVTTKWVSRLVLDHAIAAIQTSR